MQQKIHFTPGPSQLYTTVASHIQTALDNHVGSISHRSPEFEEIYRNTVSALRQVLGLPDNYRVLFLGSGTEVFERVIKNLSSHSSFHFVNGAFSKRFADYSKSTGRRIGTHEDSDGTGHDVETAGIPKDTELICFTHNETSSGIATPHEDIYRIRQKYPEAFIAVDAVSSLPYADFDYNQIDTAFFSVQKCFGLPAGLGVWLVNERAIEKASALKDKGHYIGPHHELPELAARNDKHQTPTTPNVLAIYLLGRVCQDFLEAGMQGLRQDIETKANLLYDFVNNSDLFSPPVVSPLHRSRTVIVADSKLQSGVINKKLAPKGFVIGAGYGEAKDSQIRIANFFAHDVGSIKELIKELGKL